jgi:hypothetical protein
MPLYPSAKDLIGIQLDLIARGEQVRLIVIGELTATQHRAINEARSAFGLPSLESPELVYVGKHHFKSRVIENGYALHDLFEQITRCLAFS